MKNLSTDEGDVKENQKIIKCRYCRWKNLPTWAKDREGKTGIGGEKSGMFEGETWLIKDLNDKGLGW